MEYTSFKAIKVYVNTDKELEVAVNKLKAKRIISIKPTIPEYTTTGQCYSVYYEYYITKMRCIN